MTGVSEVQFACAGSAAGSVGPGREREFGQMRDVAGPCGRGREVRGGVWLAKTNGTMILRGLRGDGVSALSVGCWTQSAPASSRDAREHLLARSLSARSLPPASRASRGERRDTAAIGHSGSSQAIYQAIYKDEAVGAAALLLLRFFPRWRELVLIVIPKTVIRWHRQGFRGYWRWKSRNRTARPSLTPSSSAILNVAGCTIGTSGATRPDFRGGLNLSSGITTAEVSLDPLSARHRGAITSAIFADGRFHSAAPRSIR